MRSLETRLPPPVLVLLTGATMWLAARALPPLAASAPARAFAAGLLTLLAGLAGGGAMLAFRSARTTVNPVNPEAASTIVTTGPFARTRNPMYVAFTALLAAWAVALAQPWALLGPALFALYITRFQIIPEERALGAKFGAPYDAYRARVRRWV